MSLVEINLYKNDYIFAKVGQEKYILDSYEKGNLCFNPFEEYRKNANASISDKDENIDFLYQGGDDCELIINGYQLTKSGGLLSAKLDLPTNLKEVPVIHAFCCKLIKVNDKNIKDNKIFLPDKMKGFGDCALIIFNPKIFLERVKKQILSHKDIIFLDDTCLGAIKYRNFNNYSGNIGAFVKDTFYEDQSEYRITFSCNASEKILINIGSMKDIAVIGYLEAE